MKTTTAVQIISAPPPAGFVEVERDAYYEALNTSPGIGSIINQYERGGRGYVTESRDGYSATARVIAVRYSGDFPFTKTRFFLPA
jgi:hypothetical protein